MSRTPFLRSSFLAALAWLACAGVANCQTFSVLFDFGPENDPLNPSFEGIIAQGRDGLLYSTSPNVNSGANGTFFNITTAGLLTVPYYFIAGNVAESGATLGTDGNFYVTTEQSENDAGELYQITPSGVHIVHVFTGGSDGGGPKAPPVEGFDENYYGTTNSGGANGWGTVYKLTPAGKFTTIYSFVSFAEGADPWAPLVQGTDGNFYGVTFEGGSSGGGVFYKITRAGQFTALNDFSGIGGAVGPLVEGNDGNYYGTTSQGGSDALGTVFKVTPAGKLTVLHNFTGSPDGSTPNAGLVLANDGNFYGVTEFGGDSTNCQNGCGTIFKMTPSGTVSILYNFDLTTGYEPNATLTQHTNGLLYVDTTIGGMSTVCTQGCGVFFSLETNPPLKPFARLVLPAGIVGSTVEMLGQGFTGTSSVSFNGVNAKFSVVTDTYLTATLPSGAKTGSVKVTTPSGVLLSNRSFRVTPQIKSFTPPSGAVGTVVTITGAGLIQTSKVTFGGVAATTFTVNSDSQVAATVPTGALTGKIVITTPGGTASSASSFTVTP
ncbi:MAG TPA: choice-of-anchor tandem repeat GloVer-containing protein [Candidatus Binatia bacterium]|nr:choice-of-anchor tandem repeat GloVer-containing protein [Candidatus Binatia bacterium]